jgi:hypothetical protein
MAPFPKLPALGNTTLLSSQNNLPFIVSGCPPTRASKIHLGRESIAIFRLLNVFPVIVHKQLNTMTAKLSVPSLIWYFSVSPEEEKKQICQKCTPFATSVVDCMKV